MKITLRRRHPASPGPARHVRPATAPQPQPWVPAPLTPTELHAGHAYLPGSIDWLRRLAEALRGEADDLDTQAYDAFALAARKRQEALDVDRLLALAESDQAGLVPPDFFAAPEPQAVAEADEDPRPVHYAPGSLFFPICGEQRTGMLISSSPEDMSCLECIQAYERGLPVNGCCLNPSACTECRTNVADTLTLPAVQEVAR